MDISARTDVLVVGDGPTGTLVAHLALDRGLETVVVGTNPLQSLSVVTVRAPHATDPTTVSLLPIFPVYGSNVVNEILARDSERRGTVGASADTLWIEPELEFRHAFLTEHVSAASTSGPEIVESFARFADRLHYPAAQLAVKQYGRHHMAEPLREVRAKIERNYLSRTPAPRRVGYVNGVSPYRTRIAASSDRLCRLDTSVVHIDAPARTATLADRRSLRYRRLIACLPPHRLAELVGLAPPALSYCAAHFAIAHLHDETKPSVMVYDHRPDSPIVRAGTPTGRVAVVQLSPDEVRADAAHPDGHVDPGRLRDWLPELVSAELAGVEPDIWTVPMAYPLEPLPAAWMDSARPVFEQAAVTPFGRAAQWTYRDLHELDWAGLEGTLDAH